jgi:hypothetical protein
MSEAKNLTHHEFEILRSLRSFRMTPIVQIFFVR